MASKKELMLLEIWSGMVMQQPRNYFSSVIKKMMSLGRRHRMHLIWQKSMKKEYKRLLMIWRLLSRIGISWGEKFKILNNWYRMLGMIIHGNWIKCKKKYWTKLKRLGMNLILWNIKCKKPSQFCKTKKIHLASLMPRFNGRNIILKICWS